MNSGNLCRLYNTITLTLQRKKPSHKSISYLPNLPCQWGTEQGIQLQICLCPIQFVSVSGVFT